MYGVKVIIKGVEYIFALDNAEKVKELMQEITEPIEDLILVKS